MRSIRVILSLSLAMLSGGAAADWTAVTDGNNIFSACADLSSIRQQGMLVRMSGMNDFRRQDFTPSGNGLFSTVVLREYDCRERSVRMLSSIDFLGPMGSGTAVDTSNRPGRWEPIVRGALNEAFWKIACG